MSTPQPISRPLAPAPPPLTGAISDSAASSPGGNPPNQSTGIKRASTACQTCKQIKRKCDQAHPCSNCRKTNTLCTYKEADDGRRKAARKRTFESLELKRDALDSILDSLRSSDDRHVQALVHLIRSHAPLEDIVQYTNKNATNLPRDQVQNITTLVNGRPRKTVLSVNDLCDTPLVKVPSSPWTSITDDEEFVSHLISIYFTWFHMAYPVMVKDLFLSDMANGELDCQYCSPLLVNAMLSMACHFSDHPRACKIPSDSNTRGRHFLDEATRMWSEQEGRLSLVNIQAIAILAVSSTLVGKDRLSLSYVEQVERMQQEFCFKTAQAEARGTQQISVEMKRSQILISRTAFLLAVGFGGAFMRPSVVQSPVDRISLSHPHLEENVIWLPYPKQSPEVSIAFGALHQAYFSLHEIGYYIQRISFGNKSTTPAQEVRSLDEKLRSWKVHLPISLSVDDNSSIIKPPVMDLHLVYHWFRMTLFNFVNVPHPPLVTPSHPIDLVQSHPRMETLESAKTIVDLDKRYSRDYGLKQPTIWMPQTALSAAHSIIDVISDPVLGTLVQDIFHELCLVLVAASQRWLVMKGHVRMLFLTAEKKGQKLPPKTEALLKFVALDRWGESDHLQFASASYPNYSLAKDDDPRLTAMGDLLERWAHIRSNEEGEEALVKNAHALTAGSVSSAEDTEQRSPVTPNMSIKGNMFLQ